MTSATVATLSPLVPARTVSLAVRFDPPISSARATAWRDALAADLGEADLRVVDEGTPGSVHVTIGVSVDADVGTTGAGVAFRVARAHATVRILRASVEIDGRPAVAPATAPPDDVAARSTESLRDRVVAALTW